METRYILFTLFYLGFLAFIMSLDIPNEMKFIKPIDFVWFCSGIIVVAGSCTVMTGLACPVALGVFTVATFLNYLVMTMEWFKLLIFMPIVVTLIYVVSRLARGGG